MTDLLREELEGRLEDAERCGDQTMINAARKAIEHATLLCQAHTAERIKKIEADAAETRQDVRDIKTQITGIATSRAVLTEKYDATTVALTSMQGDVNSLKTEFKAEFKSIKTLKVVVYVFTGLMLLTIIYGAVGKDGFNSVTNAHRELATPSVAR